MKRAAVCFGGKSALEILRVVGTGGLVAPKGKGRVLPDRVPHAAELRALVEEVEAACPGLRLERPVHVVARSVANCRGTQLAKPRACTRPLSGGSLLRLGDHVLVCSPGLAFVQMAAREKDRISLLELGWELCGSYRGPRSSSQLAYQVDPLVTVRALRAYAARTCAWQTSRMRRAAMPAARGGTGRVSHFGRFSTCGGTLTGPSVEQGRRRSAKCLMADGCARKGRRALPDCPAP